MSSNNDIVLVTGSSGFLGQHLIKLLQERDDSVKEIRCFDTKPYSKFLDFPTRKPIRIMTGDICNSEQIFDALENVNCVIHCATIFDTTWQPDFHKMHSVNIEGTQNVLKMSIHRNVRSFILISTVDVVCGDIPIYFGNENTTKIPNSHIFEAFSLTKVRAENIVKEANDKLLYNGVERMRTIILRPTLMYGECDPYFVTEILKIAKENGSVFPLLDNIFIRTQVTYVGNVAWAILKAKEQLKKDKSVSGEEFFITDDTEIMSTFDFSKPFLESRGYRLSKNSYPFWLVLIILSLYLFFAKLLEPFYKIYIPRYAVPCRIKYICNTYFFNRSKATLRLSYYPLFTNEESMKNSLDFYKSVDI